MTNHILKRKYNLSKIGILMYRIGAIKLNKQGTNAKIRLFHPIGFISVIIVLIILPFLVMFFNDTIQEAYKDLFDYVCLW